MKIVEGIKKNWWIIPIGVIFPVLYLVSWYLHSRDKVKKNVEEYLKP